MRMQAQSQMSFPRPEPTRPVVRKHIKQPEIAFFVGQAVRLFGNYLFFLLVLQEQKLQPRKTGPDITQWELRGVVDPAPRVPP